MKINRLTRKIFAVILAGVLVIPAAGTTYAAETDNAAEDIDLESLQEDRLEALEENAGEYAEDSFIIEGTSREEAEYAASLIEGSELRMNEDEDLAVIYLPDDVSLEDVYTDDEMGSVLPKIMENSYVTLFDTDAQGNTLEPSAPDFELTDDRAEKQTYLNYIDLKDTWKYSKGAGVTVAIIDTGIDIDNSEFAGKISEDSFNASEGVTVKSAGMGVIDDTVGHGTKVASVIAAAMDGNGVVGIAPDAELLIIKLELDSSGNLSVADCLFGFEYAVNHGADIINMSFGTTEDCFINYTARAAAGGVIMVASAGNDGTSTPMYPAADPDVIGVGALAQNSWDIADYSNYGAGIFVVAPGTVYTTTINETYRSANGTSFASPVVAAAIALYLSYNGGATPAKIQELLKTTSVDLGDEGMDETFGYGALDVYKLVFGENGPVYKDGFVLEDGVYNYYIDNVFMGGYTGIVKSSIEGTSAWYYVINGVYDDSAEGLTRKADGSASTWYYVQDGKYVKTAAGLARKADGSSTVWYYVLNGKYTKNTGLAKKADGSSATWYYCLGGKYVKGVKTVCSKADGSADKLYYVKNSKYTKATGTVIIDGIKYVVTNGVAVAA